MAFYIFKIKHFPFPKPVILIYLLIITSFFSEPSPFTNFNFSNFTFGDPLIKYERAFVEDSVIRLTGNSSTVRSYIQGRDTYFNPMHLWLWDKASGNLTNFTTHFSFVINSPNKSTLCGDGLAFFLAANGSTILDVTGDGGAMGLITLATDPFVAVEFDIFSNEWNLPGEHRNV
jgi:hypothetical protein